MRRRNQHGGRKCDDLQNQLDMTSHENPLFVVPMSQAKQNVKHSQGYSAKFKNLYVNFVKVTTK